MEIEADPLGYLASAIAWISGRGGMSYLRQSRRGWRGKAGEKRAKKPFLT